MLLAFGLGYSAYALARRRAARGEKIVGTLRESPRDAAQSNDSIGISRMRFAADTPLGDIERAIGAATHVLVSIPPDDASLPFADVVLAKLASRIADAHNILWLGYLSTTGVYGDRCGAWVDETSERRPGNVRSARRAAAEDAWLALWRDRGVPVHLFRLSGIYGPGRSAIDIANVLEASMARPRPGAIYNVADDAPAPAHEVVAHAAALLGMPAPPLEPYDPARLPLMAREFYSETRRIRNDRIKQELGVTLLYPDYKAGLAAILNESKP
jgi:nucleoside-diphosphate-sugar epimerase